MRLFAFLLLLPALSFAQVPHTFQNGDVADAEKINENFDALNQRILSLETLPTRDDAGMLYMDIDCSSDSGALADMIQATAHLDPVKFNISGDCLFEAGFIIYGRVIRIYGDPRPEVRPRLLLGEGQNFVVESSAFDIWYTDIEVGNAFLLTQNVSATLFGVNFSGPAAPTIKVRANSNLRLINALQAGPRPSIKVTAGTLWIASNVATTKLNRVSASIGSKVWCWYCNVDIPSLILDINSSLCASDAYDELPDDGNSNPVHLNLGELTVRTGSVFVHEGAPSAQPTYVANVLAGSIAEWNVGTSDESRERCAFR